jgi:hypothetical protein
VGVAKGDAPVKSRWDAEGEALTKRGRTAAAFDSNPVTSGVWQRTNGRGGSDLGQALNAKE